ncbi:hypothetical protein GCM10010329_72680 [Streptomyces spiroverticillatus]|nr:hypothetical protein GCM10010329_72680 [Streptomyces spiroverticillatus]
MTLSFIIHIVTFCGPSVEGSSEEPPHAERARVSPRTAQPATRRNVRGRAEDAEGAVGTEDTSKGM